MKYIDECKAIAEESLPDQDEQHFQKEMAAIRSNRAYKRQVGLLAVEVEGKTQQLQIADLTDEQGIRKTLKLQGEVLALRRCLDLLTEGTES